VQQNEPLYSITSARASRMGGMSKAECLRSGQPDDKIVGRTDAVAHAARLGPEEVPFVCEVKARKDGSGFAQLERWLGDFDLLAFAAQQCGPTHYFALGGVGHAAVEGAAKCAAESNCRANASST
jgi:hypothetical protein